MPLILALDTLPGRVSGFVELSDITEAREAMEPANCTRMLPSAPKRTPKQKPAHTRRFLFAAKQRDYWIFALSLSDFIIAWNCSRCHAWSPISICWSCGFTSSNVGIFWSRTSTSSMMCQPNWVLTGVSVI